MVSTTMKRLLLLALSYFREGRCMKCLRMVNPEKFFFWGKVKGSESMHGDIVMMHDEEHETRQQTDGKVDKDK
jgi:hypothetical protein